MVPWSSYERGSTVFRFAYNITVCSVPRQLSQRQGRLALLVNYNHSSKNDIEWLHVCTTHIPTHHESGGRSENDLHELVPRLLQSVEPQSAPWARPELSHSHSLQGQGTVEKEINNRRLGF